MKFNNSGKMRKEPHTQEIETLQMREIADLKISWKENSDVQ